MHEDFVTYEQAKDLKELGFDWDCNFIYYLTYHNHNKPIFQLFETTDYYGVEKYWFAPTLSQAKKWLREIYGIDVDIDSVYHRLDTGDKVMYGLRIGVQRTFQREFYRNYDSYEEALSVGIDQALKLLKQQNNDGYYRNNGTY